MLKIKITCDSTSDLTEELYQKYQIDMLPLGVSMGDDLRQDCVNVTAQELYDYAEKTGQLPKTSAVSVGDYLDCFKKYVDMGYQVIHISLSSNLSSSYANACMAANATGNVFVVDSENLSTGSGYLAVLARELASGGCQATEIVSVLDDVKKRLDVSFVLQTLNYLHKGGRCSGIAAFGANLLKLRPEILVKNGKMIVGKKYRGDMEKSILAYIRGRLEGADDIEHDRIFITHSGVPEDIVAKVAALIRQLHPFNEVIETIAGSTISSHCGPACLGIVYVHCKAKKEAVR